MKKYILFLIAIVTWANGYSQQDIQHTFEDKILQYKNPSSSEYSGTDIQLSYNNRWMQSSYNPSLMYLGVDHNFRNKNATIGLIVFNDITGHSNSINVMANYGYQLKLQKDNYLSIGLGLGFLSNKLSNDWITPVMIEQNSSIQDDVAAPSIDRKTVFDNNLGVSFRNQKIYIGLSATHLTQSQLYTKDYFLKRTYYIDAQYIFYQKASIEMSQYLGLKTDGSATNATFVTKLMYKKMFGMAIGYRLTQDYIIRLEAAYNQINVGLAYEYNYNKLNQNGSFGLYLYYKISSPKEKAKQNTSIRIN